MLHQHPTAAQLAESVREFLERDIFPATEGQTQFHTRVAVNALKIIERELEYGPRQEHEHSGRLAALGVADDSELARSVRDGVLDDRYAEVLDAVTADVEAKLEVANPRYLSQPA